MGEERQPGLFGTDGIRGITGQYPLDRVSILKLARCLGDQWRGKKLLLGRDTRASGSQIVDQLIRGVGDNADIFDCQVIPTPGLSHVIDRGGYDGGVMVTASHNPGAYNGIKLFLGSGEKPPDELESHIEEKFFSMPPVEEKDLSPKNGPPVNNVHDQAMDLYQEFLLRSARGLDLSGLKIVLDCAHGATYRIAPAVFRALNPGTEVINDRPDGWNINEKCGSTDLENLTETVASDGADLGIAFDGDGDRVIFVDREGFVLDGDYALFLISHYLKMSQGLANNLVVGTIMSNLGLEDALARKGIKLIRTRVGDKNVSREMAERKTDIGGEKSGHIILSPPQKTGDGILTALFFLKSLSHFQLRPEQVKKQLTPAAQESRNIAIREKRDLERWEELNRLRADFNRDHGDHSRVVIRYSGTEPVVRVMMESKYQDVIDKNLDLFVRVIESSIGEKK